MAGSECLVLSTSVRNRNNSPCLLTFFPYKTLVLLCTATSLLLVTLARFCPFCPLPCLCAKKYEASKMHSPSLLVHVALVIHFLFSSTLSYRLPVDEVFRRGLEKKDLVCVEDDVLLSFQEYAEDSVPFCSDYLSIGISTSTVPITGRTYACPTPFSGPIFRQFVD